MSLIQLLKFKKWETRLFKMPRLGTPRFLTGTRVTGACGLSFIKVLTKISQLFHAIIYGLKPK